MAEDRNGEVPKGSLYQRKENVVPDISNENISIGHDK